jgi:hypothetical protein
MTDLHILKIPELLGLHSEVLAELRQRKVIRSNNNPTGDYAEWLVSEKLGLKLAQKSQMGFDAIDETTNLRYQIKGRRVTPDNKSAQLGTIRNLEANDFDFLVAVIFDLDWQVVRAAKIPHECVADLAIFKSHVNGHIMHLRPSIFDNPSIEDLSRTLSS